MDEYQLARIHGADLVRAAERSRLAGEARRSRGAVRPARWLAAAARWLRRPAPRRAAGSRPVPGWAGRSR
ncbi:MAG: hypothetical protein V7637_1275 [Mycobacteriales bacterium]|jgi:hypothetical protein